MKSGLSEQRIQQVLDFRLPLRCKKDLGSSEMLRSVDWQILLSCDRAS